MQIVTKQIITDVEQINTFKQNAHNIASLGFKGLSINVFTCDKHKHEFLLSILGLGHEMHIIYLFDPEEQGIITPEFLVNECFSDFKDFIVYEREEHHGVMH